MRRHSVLAVLVAAAGTAAWADAPPRVSTAQLTLPWFTAEPNWKTRPNHGGAFFYKEGTVKQEGTRTFNTVVLENTYIKTDIIPALGGVIHRTIHKPTSNDYFYREEKAKNYVPFWESGVKVCFPYHEHGLHTEGQPVAHRTVTHADGAVTLAMWMEFSRFREPWNTAMFGRHNWATLAQFVTVRPDENAVHVRYRLTNTAPYRQGRRIWSDAFYPRNHTKDGPVMGDKQPPASTTTEWIFPTAWVSDHGGTKLRRYSEEDTRLAAYKDPNNSLFAWDSLWFAGLYYPDVQINRLRVWNHGAAPGAKQFFLGEGSYKPGTPMTHLYNLVELWGGSDHVFEGVEHWIEPGGVYEFGHTYTLAAGLGKATMANNEVVLAPGTEDGAAVLKIAFLRPHADITLAFDQGPPEALRNVSPAKIETVRTAATRVTIRSGRNMIYAGAIAPAAQESTAHHAAIKKTFNYHAAQSLEMRAADPQNKGYRGAIAAYPDGSTDRGRVLYRDGQLDAAVTCLATSTAANANDAEAWHLLGVAHLEKGNRADAKTALSRALECKPPYVPARYYLALVAIAEDPARSPAAARTLVGDLHLKSNPPHPLRNHWQSRLLSAYIAGVVDDPHNNALEQIRHLEAESPADPTVVYVLLKSLEHAKDPAAPATKKVLDTLLAQEPGAQSRLDEFTATLRGDFTPPPRMDRFPPSTQKK